MGGRGDDHQWVFHEGMGDQVGGLKQASDDREILVGFVEQREAVRAVVDVEAQHDLEMALAKDRPR